MPPKKNKSRSAIVDNGEENSTVGAISNPVDEMRKKVSASIFFPEIMRKHFEIDTDDPYNIVIKSREDATLVD